MKIKLPDGNIKDFDEGSTGCDIASAISQRLAQDALAISVDGELVDLNQEISGDCEIKIITFDEEEGKKIFWHSAAHIMAYAVKEIYPYAKPTIGPAIDEGFYYDFDHKPFSPDDLEKIENKMKEISREKLPFEKKTLVKEEAKKLFKDNEYKIELIDEIEGDTVTIYTLGKFVDLCKGPHVPHSGKIKSFKLTKVAGAYWKGNSENKQLQRIYGIGFPDKKDLKIYLSRIEEAERRDHRKLGRELELFSFHEEGTGFPFWHAKGSIIYNNLLFFLREENYNRGYEEIKTPMILNEELWHRSGHWDNFRENMYFTKIDDKDCAVKPMNCPGGLLIYKSRLHSYRELPIRNAEFGLVHRHELSGVLHGLFRVRCFTQDDAHSFCTEEQLEDELVSMVDYAVDIYKTFGFDKYETFIATRPDKSIGSDEVWNTATLALEKALEKKGLEYGIKEGEGAFYGPKIEFNIKDTLGRNWQCGTIQVDFSMPEKFEATYEGEDGKKHTPVMVHRAIIGSLERFIGILIEHYAAKFPLWLSPLQIKLLPIADRHIEGAEKILKIFKESGLRVEIDKRSESINKKVRDAQSEKANYILVIGDKEIENKTVNIRTRNNEILGEKKVDEFIKDLQKEIDKKEIR